MSLRFAGYAALFNIRDAGGDIIHKGAFDRTLAELAAVRCCRMIDMTGRKGRPRVHQQIEEMEEGLQALAHALGAIPTFL